MVGWHHRLNGHEFEQAPGGGEGQGRTALACCSPWAAKSQTRLSNGTTTHASKVMFKILHAEPQNNVDQELPDVQAGFRKGRGTRHQISSIRWITDKAREFQKYIYFYFIDHTIAFDCVDHNKMENS